MKFSIKDFISLKRLKWSFGVFSPIYIKNLCLWYRLWADNARNNKFSIFEEIPQLTRRIIKWNFSKIFQICQLWGIVVGDGIPGCNAPIGFIDALTFLRSVRRCWRIDAFELWCWKRLLRIPWTARRSNQSIPKEISPEYSLEGLMLKLKLQYFGHPMRRTDSLEKILMLEKIEHGRRRGWQRMR